MTGDQDSSKGGVGAGERALLGEIAATFVESLGLGPLDDWLQVEDFQVRILQTCLIILVFNIFLISIAWKMYGPRIAERFMKSASNSVLEDLKQGATDLKLPTEHSPRI